MKDPAIFHTNLLGEDPTPEQRRLYAAFPEQRGSSGEGQDPDRFLATFIAALLNTWDGEAKACQHKVALAIPRAIEPWCVDQINLFLERMKVRQKKLPKATIKYFLQAMRCVETGTRVFTVTEAPKRWFAFGFSVDSVAPEWLKKGLLV